MEDAGDVLQVSGHHGAHALRSAGLAVPQDGKGYAEQDGIGVGRVRPNSDRYWVIGAAEKLAQHHLVGESGQADRVDCDWRLADIRDGLPQIYLGTAEAFVAQMLNLDLLDGISFSKGCYTGQEIIARTQHLGRIKRRLYRLHLPDGEWSVGQSVRLIDGRSGRLVEVVPSGGSFEALAVLGVQAAAESGEADLGGGAAASPAGAVSSIAASQLPLPYAV
jgi:folate-binding protein YgfZ